MKPARSETYRRWIASRPCLVCGGESQAAHVEHGGMALKGSDFSCVPLCWRHHLVEGEKNSLHHGRAQFERAYGIDLSAVVSDLNTQWRSLKSAA